jgi:hypothetical protein
MAVAQYDLVRQTVGSAPGTGSTIALSAAQTGWLTFALAGVANGATVRYAINDPGSNNTEIGTATYSTSGPSLTGRTPTKSSNSNAAINASAQSIIISCAAAEDLAVGGTNYGTMAGQNASTVAITGGSATGLTSLGIGTSTPDSLFTLNANTGNTKTPPSGTIFHMIGITASKYLFDGFGGQPLIVGRRADGALGSETAVQSGETLFALSGQGYGATGYGVGGRAFFGMVAAQNWTDTAQGAEMTFQTTPLNSTTLTSAMQIWPSGGVSINSFGSDPGLGNLAVGGTIIANGSGTFPQPLSSVVNLSGSTLPAGNAVWLVDIASDTANVGGGFSVGLNITQIFGGSAAIGGRSSIYTTLVLDAPTSGSNPNRNYIGGAFTAQATSGDGGTNLTTNALGAIFGFSAIGVANGGTNLLNVTGAEINCGLYSGSSAKYKTGLQVVQLASDIVAGASLDCLVALTSQAPATGLSFGIVFSDSSSAQPVSSTGTLIGISNPNSTTTSVAKGIDFSAAVFSGNAFASPGFSVSGAANLTATGPLHTLGSDTVSGGHTYLVIQGGQTNTTDGSFIAMQSTSHTEFQFGNYSAIYGTNNAGAAAYDPLGGFFASNGLSFQMGAGWLYYSGFSNATTLSNNGGTTPIHPSGLAIGWNQSGSAGEVNLVANLGLPLGTTGPWDFIFQDWNGTTLTDVAFISKGGGIYVPSTLSQTVVGGCTFPVGSGVLGSIGGSLPTPTTSGNAETYFSVGFGSSDSTKRVVPYNSGGALLGDALSTTLFVGNIGNGSGDPSPQGSSLAGSFSHGKASASISGGTGVYGQTGCVWMNVWGGWNGIALTFTQTVTLTTSSKTLTVPAAPTSHAYVQGMPVSGTGIPASTVIVTVNSGTSITLNNTPTVNASETLTFTAGGSAAINPQYGGTPGDTFMINADIRIYDNGLGIAEMFEGNIAQYALGATTNTHGVLLQIGLTGSGISTSIGATHAIGYVAKMTGNSGVEGVAFYASAGASNWGLFAAASGFEMGVGGTITSISDPAIKKNIRVMPDMLNAVKAISPVLFEWGEGFESHTPSNRSGRVNWGFVAHDTGGVNGVLDVMDAIGHDFGAHRTKILEMDPAGGRLGLHTGRTFSAFDHAPLVPILWRGVQELESRVTELESCVTELESRGKADS